VQGDENDCPTSSQSYGFLNKKYKKTNKWKAM
jgi:hypothetical protein